MTKAGSLSRQLLLKVVGFSVLLTVVSTLFNGLATFRFETQRQQDELNAVLTAYSSGLSKAAWELDTESIRAQLSGLSHFESVLSAEVVAGDLRETYAKPKGNLQQAGQSLTYPLRSPDGRSEIAVWTLRLDRETLWQRVLETSRTFMFLLAAELLVQALLIYWLAGRAVSRPIHALARHVARLKSLGLSTPVPQPEGPRRNELHQLAEGIGQLQEDLQCELAHRDQASQSLSLREQQLLRISLSEVIDAGDLQGTFHLITTAACVGLRVQRASIWFWDEARGAIVCAMLQDQKQGQSLEATRLAQADFPHYFAALRDGRAILAHDARTDPRTSEFAQPYLEPLGIVAMLDVAIRHGGQLVGVLCCEHTSNVRQWREEEGFFASALADLVSRAMTAESRVRAEAELKNLLATLERRVADRTAQLQDSNQNLETFAFSVSHDLKAPLRGIEGYSRLLQSDYRAQLPDEAKGFVDNIRTASERMHDLIEDLLAYSRVGRRELSARSFSVRGAVERVLLELGHDFEDGHTTLINHLEDATLTADLECFVQIMRNLIDNAIKFTRDAPVPTIELRSDRRPGFIVLCVKDNGCGFDMKYHDRIFAIFQRLHRNEAYAGTGVGLAIVSKAAERLGGRVWAVSSPGQGAAFFLEMPCP